MKNKYGLLFKTGDSEIRALRNFSNKKGIFPIIELTRGRKTKKDTIGDIQKRIDQLAECFGNMDIILDLLRSQHCPVLKLICFIYQITDIKTG